MVKETYIANCNECNWTKRITFDSLDGEELSRHFINEVSCMHEEAFGHLVTIVMDRTAYTRREE